MNRKRVGKIASGTRWAIVIMVAFALLGLAFVLRTGWQGSSLAEVDLAYGFAGKVYRFGEPMHEIVYGDGIEPETLESLGSYLEQIGYFSAEYGGVIQIRSREGGYDVFLTYSKGYWELPEFLDEVSSIRDDLETNVLQSSTRIFLADQDENGVYTEALGSRSRDSL